jgi:hypothetical protein
MEFKDVKCYYLHALKELQDITIQLETMFVGSFLPNSEKQEQQIEDTTPKDMDGDTAHE